MFRAVTSCTLRRQTIRSTWFVLFNDIGRLLQGRSMVVFRKGAAHSAIWALIRARGYSFFRQCTPALYHIWLDSLSLLYENCS